MLSKNNGQHLIHLASKKIHPAGFELFNGKCVVGSEAKNAIAALVRSEPLKTKDFDDDLSIVGRAGAGVDTIDDGEKFEEATARGICISFAAGGNAKPVAQITVASITGNMRQISNANTALQALRGKDDAAVQCFVDTQRSGFSGPEFETQTLGVIGLGHVGIEVVNLAISLGMKVIGYDSYLTVRNALRLTNDPKFTIAKSMNEVLSTADIITVHVPLNSKTRHLIGGPQIALMRDGATVVNYARGSIYDDTAVIEALNTGKLSWLLTDFPTAELIHPKVFATPHLGASTPESERRCSLMVCQQVRDFLDFGTVTNSVNFPTVEVPLHSDTHTRITIVNRDIPGMIASYTRLLADAGLNIPNVPGDNNGTIGYYIIDVPTAVPDKVLQAIHDAEGVIRVRAIPINR